MSRDVLATIGEQQIKLRGSARWRPYLFDLILASLFFSTWTLSHWMWTLYSQVSPSTSIGVTRLIDYPCLKSVVCFTEISAMPKFLYTMEWKIGLAKA